MDNCVKEITDYYISRGGIDICFNDDTEIKIPNGYFRISIGEEEDDISYPEYIYISKKFVSNWDNETYELIHDFLEDKLYEIWEVYNG